MDCKPSRQTSQEQPVQQQQQRSNIWRPKEFHTKKTKCIAYSFLPLLLRVIRLCIVNSFFAFCILWLEGRAQKFWFFYSLYTPLLFSTSQHSWIDLSLPPQWIINKPCLCTFTACLSSFPVLYNNNNWDETIFFLNTSWFLYLYICHRSRIPVPVSLLDSLLNSTENTTTTTYPTLR